MLQKWIVCLIGAGFALAGGATVAKEYAIEIIVFERPAEKIDTGEQWDFSSPRIVQRLAQMTDLAGQTSEHQTADEVINLEPARLHLVESGYRILNTTRWQQPTSFYQHAPLIPLGHPGTPLAAGFVRIYTTSLIYADLHLQLSPLLPVPVPDDSVLNDFDGLAAEAEAADANASVAVKTDETGADAEIVSATSQQPHYFITEKRRLKFKQVHYFDHPLFGAILGLWETEVAEVF